MIELNIGNIIHYNSEKYKIEYIIDSNSLFAEKLSDGTKQVININEIDTPPKEKTTDDIKTLEGIDEKSYNIAKERYEIIKPLLNTYRTKQDVLERAKKFNKSAMTLYNWIRAYENSSNSIMALMPNYKKRGGKGKHRINEESLKVVYDVIKSDYLSSQKPKITQTLNVINALLAKEKLPKISYTTLQRIISKIDERYLYKKRVGRSKFLNHLKEAPDNFNAKFPLETIQIDHTPLDIQIVDETYRKPIGRPYITVAMDIYSRMIYAYYLTLDAPSLYSVGQTIYMGLLPKDRYLSDIGVNGEWGIYGIPTNIHLDNAKEFRSKGLEQFCDVMGINIDFRPKGQPYYGGHIERVIKTLNLEIHKLKGTTFSNIQDRGDYKSENKAIFTLKELEKYITEWIVNYYHKKPHLGIDSLTPEAKFKQGLLGDEDNPPIGLKLLSTEEEKRFAKISLLPYEFRTIQKTGVSIFGIKYFDESLIPFITPSKNNTKYIFKYDPKDLRKIYFYHPDLKDYIEILARNRFFPTVTKWEIDLARKHLKDARKKDYNEEQLLETILRLRELEENSAKKTKQHRRQKDNRTNTKTLSSKYEPKTKTAKQSRKELNIKKFDIDF